MVEFRIGPEPTPTTNPENLEEHGINELKDFSADQIAEIDYQLNRIGNDLSGLKNLFEDCKKDRIDTAEFVATLKTYSETIITKSPEVTQDDKAQAKDNLKRLLKEWFDKVY